MAGLLSGRITSPRAAVAAVIVIAAGAISLGIFGWRGRPERHLARAEAGVNEGDLEAAAEWLAVPEEAPATRERAHLLRARMAVERGKPIDAVEALERVDPDGPNAAE